MIVDKPMTKILPELYEENNELPAVYDNLLITNNKTNNKQYRLKRKSVNSTKNQLFHNNFGF